MRESIYYENQRNGTNAMVYMQFVNNAVNHEISMIYLNFNEVQDLRNVETKPL